MTVGELIKNARKAAGYTQKQLSEKSGVAAVSIQQYERGIRQPRFGQLEKIAEALNVSIMYFSNHFNSAKEAMEEYKDAKREQNSLSALEAYLRTMYGVCEPRQFTFSEFTFKLLVCGSGNNEIVIEDEDFYTISCAVHGLISSMVSCLGKSVDEIESELSSPSQVQCTSTQLTPTPQEGKDANPPQDAPETPPEGE